MRISSALILIALAAAACTTKVNEAVCCVTEADCARLGLDEPRPCEVGQACKAFACVASECSTSADCTSPEAPVCVHNLCVASCRVDDDCAGATGGPHCAEDGVCVGCLTNADCAAGAPFCDAEDRSCRGCELDAECASGVCIEVDAVCAEPGEIVHVRMGGTDTGGCTSDSPCGTLEYALQQVTVSRNVIRIGGGSLATPISTIAIDRSVVIDGADTTISKPVNVPLFSVGALAGVVTFGGLTLVGSADPADPTLTVASGSLLRVARSVLDTAVVDVVNGGLELRDVRIATALETVRSIRCTNGTVSARGVDFDHATIGALNCQLHVSRCRFNEIADGSISAQGGVAIVENNLLVNAYELADMMSLTSLAPGSVVRFNTFVNTSGVSSDGIALLCDGTAAVTSNIFAYGSAHPMGPPGGTPCPTRFSLFDTVATAEQTGGEGNQVGDAATFFANRATRDFRLSSTSPARGAAEPNLPVVEDFEGNPRPAPHGSRADIGCFEAR